MRENRQKNKYESQSQENLKLLQRIEEIEKMQKVNEEKLKSKILILETVRTKEFFSFPSFILAMKNPFLLNFILLTNLLNFSGKYDTSVKMRGKEK
jgi:hypothetical protein